MIHYLKQFIVRMFGWVLKKSRYKHCIMVSVCLGLDTSKFIDC